jgi:SAM-dependent methyltransferase
MTADFAQFRFERRGLAVNCVLSDGWDPPACDRVYDAVVSCDFLEHVTDVPKWAEFISSVLKPGGLFFAQNAFGIGSGPDGSMPMHLARNDRFEKDWDSLLASLNFTQLSSNWYQTPALVTA